MAARDRRTGTETAGHGPVPFGARACAAARLRGVALPAMALLAATLALPAAAQEAEPPGAAAAARLDFPTALAELSAAIEADPAAPGPRIARADLHMKMQRPALALADLGAVLEADPANLPALRARVAIWDAQQAWNRARADIDAGLAVSLADPELLALRGWVNARAGLTDAALADYDVALAAAPDNAEIARARAALLGARAQTGALDVVFGPEAVMSEAYLVEIGAPEAPATLHIVHAVPHLAEELAALDPALIDAAVDAGALRVVHLFTYTGDEASIWGSLALICAGPEGYAATHAALSDTSGRTALDTAGAGDLAPLERLLNAAYSVAGIDEGLVSSCALDRLHATRYLADWQAHRDAGAFRGVNLLDRAPSWVLNGTPVGPADLAGQLAAMVPAPAAQVAGFAGDTPSAPETAPETAPDDGTAVADAPAAGAEAPDGPPETVDQATPSSPAEVASPAPDAAPAVTPSEDTAAAPAAATPADQLAAAAPEPSVAQDGTATSPSDTPADTGTATEPDVADTEAPETEAPADQTAAATPEPSPAQDAVATPAADTPGNDSTAAPADVADTAATNPETLADQTAASAPEPSPAQDTDPAPAPQDPDTTASDVPQTPADAVETAPAAPARFPVRPEPVGDARVPVELRGVYAPSLGDCLTYLAAIEEPDRIDAVLPAINPLDGPPLGTILVTSRRAYLFNALDTECAIAASDGAPADWQGSFACTSPLAPEAAPVLAFAPAPADGTAPRITATFGTATPVVLRQCRSLGQLGNAFAPLWDRDDAACSVGVSVAQGRFAFTIDPGGNLVLRLAPDAISAETGRAQLQAVIDGAAIGEAPGRWDGTGWQMSLGPFEAAAESLGWGMFLDFRTSADGFEARLPLFGSSAAMDTLAACAAAGE